MPHRNDGLSYRVEYRTTGGWVGCRTYPDRRDAEYVYLSWRVDGLWARLTTIQKYSDVLSVDPTAPPLEVVVEVIEPDTSADAELLGRAGIRSRQVVSPVDPASRHERLVRTPPFAVEYTTGETTVRYEAPTLAEVLELHARLNPPKDRPTPDKGDSQ